MSAHSPSPRLRWRDVLGLTPLPDRLREAAIVLRGDADVPPSQFDLTSLSQLRPRVGLPLWFGRPVAARTILLSNLFNHTQTPISAGWSVKRTQVCDFRGKCLTYDSHNGTDFAVPVGSTLVAPATARVAAIRTDFNRGGLKLFLDHGQGLMTCSAHLAQVLVQVGEVVGRGQPIARTGYSGLDGFVTFLTGVPHVHFNTWLGAEPVDPFAGTGEAALWVGHNQPQPCTPAPPEADFVPSVFDAQGVQAAIAACKTPAVRERLQRYTDLQEAGTHVVIEMNYYPTRFAQRVQVYAQPAERRERLHLPFLATDFTSFAFLDDWLAARG